MWFAVFGYFFYLLFSLYGKLKVDLNNKSTWLICSTILLLCGFLSFENCEVKKYTCERVFNDLLNSIGDFHPNVCSLFSSFFYTLGSFTPRLYTVSLVEFNYDHTVQTSCWEDTLGSSYTRLPLQGFVRSILSIQRRHKLVEPPSKHLDSLSKWCYSKISVSIFSSVTNN